MMELLERLYQIKTYREPDRPSPVRVAAKEARGGFRRLVVHAMLLPIDAKHIGMVLVKFGKGANTMFGEKFGFVQQIPQDASEPRTIDDGEQRSRSALGFLGPVDAIRHVG